MDDPSGSSPESPDEAGVLMDDIPPINFLQIITETSGSGDADLEEQQLELQSGASNRTTSPGFSSRYGNEDQLDSELSSTADPKLLYFEGNILISRARNPQTMDEAGLGRSSPTVDSSEPSEQAQSAPDISMQPKSQGALEADEPTWQIDSSTLKLQNEGLDSDMGFQDDSIRSFNADGYVRTVGDAAEVLTKSRLPSNLGHEEGNMNLDAYQASLVSPPEIAEDYFDASKLMGRLPGFLNKENRALEEEVLALEEELKSANSALEDIKERKKLMAEHLANVKTEVQYTHSQLVARQKEISTEQHLRKLKSLEKVGALTCAN